VISSSSTLPYIASSYPSPGQTNISQGANLIINFDQNVTAVGGTNITIKKSSDDSTVDVIDAGSGRVSVSGSKVIVNPAAVFATSTSYYVLIDAGAFKNGGNENMNAVTSKTRWTFTTAFGNDLSSVTRYTTPGSYTYTVPAGSFSVYVYGGGGGGGLSGTSGTYSAFDDGGAHQVWAEGGYSWADSTGFDCTGIYPYVGGSGGTASGGDVNVTGEDGGGAGGEYFQQLGDPCFPSVGGQGGANNGPEGGSQVSPADPALVNGAPGASQGGVPGNAFGGGAAGPSGLYNAGEDITYYDPGGGGGGYASKTFSAGTYTPGSAVTVTVGAGGSNDDVSGGNGAVIILTEASQNRVLRFTGGVRLRGIRLR
jgi:hypothetical protein